MEAWEVTRTYKRERKESKKNKNEKFYCQKKLPSFHNFLSFWCWKAIVVDGGVVVFDIFFQDISRSNEFVGGEEEKAKFMIILKFTLMHTKFDIFFHSKHP